MGAHHGDSGTQADAGPVRFEPGFDGDAFALDGGRYVQVPDDVGLRLSAALTIEAWVYAYAHGGRIVDKITAGGTDGYLLDTHTSKLRLLLGPQALYTTMTLPTGQWLHVAGTFDGATARVFVDGVLLNEQAMTDPIPTNALPAAS